MSKYHAIDALQAAGRSDEMLAVTAAMPHFTLKGMTIHCTVANIAKYKLAIEKAKPAGKFKFGKTAGKRAYPYWDGEMSTAEYVRQYHNLNVDTMGGAPFAVEDLVPMPDRPSPYEDPSIPDGYEEIEEDEPAPVVSAPAPVVSAPTIAVSEPLESMSLADFIMGNKP